MEAQKREFKFALDKRPLRATPEADAAAAKTFGDVSYTVGSPKSQLDSRPDRISAAAARAAAENVHCTVGKPPKKKRSSAPD
jgi:hypothetical protein